MRIASVSVVPACITPVVVVPRAAAFASVVTGVGHKEEPFPAMGRADVGRGDDSPVHGVAEALEVFDNNVQPARNERRDVLDDDDARAELADDAGELSPEARARAREARPFAGVADVLAGEAPTHDVDGLEIVSSDMTNVSVPLGVRPVRGEHAPAPRIALHLPHDAADAGPLQAEF